MECPTRRTRKPWRRLALVACLLAVLAVVAATACGARSADRVGELAAPYGHNLALWELRYALGKGLYQVGGLLGRRPATPGWEDHSLREYFRLVAEVNSLQRRLATGDESVKGALADREQRRQALENRVEAIVEGRVEAVLRELGLARCLPLLGRPCRIFPPVDVEFESPPRVLAVSPRERIQLQRSILLRPGMSTEEVLSLEEGAAGLGVSPLVVELSGMASYPSVVSQHLGYREALEIAAHEWVHQYLIFDPLGRRYFSGGALRTINETVADIAGREVAALVGERFPLEGEPARSAPRPRRDDPFWRELRALRRAVDELLAAGQLQEAEARMERTRQELADGGFYVRKINQAYFAWYGLYADSPGSISPLGPKLRGIRERSASLREFLRAVAGITRPEDLDRLLAGRP